uniref:T9SS type A sorting domain-containing protein n=1 Tax=Alloprevotella sp. TaxID=1872471 RepID=UPI003FF01D49
ACDYVILAEGLKQGIGVGFYANVKAASSDQIKDNYTVVCYQDKTQAGSGGYIWGHSAQAEGFLANLSSQGAATALWCETEGDAGLRTEDVCAAAADQARGAVGSTQSILGQFINFGTDSIYSIDYTYENGGKTTSGTVKFREPVKYYCASTFHFDAPVNEAAGRYTNGKLTITKANGKDDEYTTGRDNEYPYVNTVALSEAYKRTPVIEEFTSTTCGNCPLGIIGLPKAVEAVNGKAVAIAVHADYDPNSYGYDPLVSSSYENVAYQYASSFPSAFVNREEMTHAYYGIVDAVKEMAEKPCEVSMTFTPKKTLQGIKMNTKLNFTIDAAEGEYGIAYAVTEDNVENVSQLNYFSYYYNEGTKKGYPQYVTWFNDLPSDVKPLATGKFTTIEDGNIISYWSDFTMNHVGCSIDDPTFATSEAVYNKLVLPAIVKGQEVAHTYTLKNPTRTAGKDNYGNALQYTSEVPAVNNENLKYAALLIDLRSGKILTGCQAALGETVTSNDKADLTAGINDVKADAADVADITAADGAFNVKANGVVAQVYDAQGRLVSSATVNGEASLPTFGKGVFIIRVTKGGNTTSQKAIF